MKNIFNKFQLRLFLIPDQGGERKWRLAGLTSQ